MMKKKLYWILQIGGWSAYVGAQVLAKAMMSVVTSAEAWFFLVEGVLFLLLTHYFRYLVKQMNWTMLPMFKIIPRVLISISILSLIVYFIRLLFSVPLGLYDPEAAWNLINILGLTAIYMIILFFWMVCYFAYHYFINYNKALKQEAAIKEIELNNLISQLNPHFIFNSLNGIRALVDENPKKSKHAITRLSNILRNSLIKDQKRVTSFDEEINLVKDYLGLEAIRYEERLKVEIDIKEGSDQFLIPPLMLQTLTENAIKHGISQLKHGGVLKLETEPIGEKLVIKIWNSGHYDPERPSHGTGLGVANTKRRLEMIYGREAKFFIENEARGTVLTYLEIPKRLEL